MDVKRLERAADKVIDTFADMRIEEREILYVAMYCVIKSNDDILGRIIEFSEQIKWEYEHRKADRSVQDRLFD